MNTTENTTEGGIRIVAIIFIIFGFIFCIQKCFKKNKENLQAIETDYNFSKDSSRIAIEKIKLELEKSEIKIELLNEDLVEVNNKVQVSETKFYRLQKKTTKPIYIEKIVDCNDSLQSCYNLSIEKDSLCNDIISEKNYIIDMKDSIIDIHKNDKSNLHILNNLELHLNKKADLVIFDQKKVIKIEKNKKNFWQYTAAILTAVSIFFGLK